MYSADIMNDETNYECLPVDQPMDETDISLPHYPGNPQSDEHLNQYDPNWSDDQVIAWDGNFAPTAH